MPPETDNAIELRGVWRTFAPGTSREVSALRGVDLNVPTGQLAVLKGRSGSGKTTLLNCIAGLDQASRGEVRVLGRDISSLDDHELTYWRRHEIGLVFQSFGLIPTLTAFENVELALRLAGTDYHIRHKRAELMLEQVGLAQWRNHRPWELSGGQQQRVAVARALANSPTLIIADEPTGELDTQTSRSLLSIFRSIVDEREITLLMTSHSTIVDEYVDQVYLLQDGMIQS